MSEGKHFGVVRGLHHQYGADSNAPEAGVPEQAALLEPLLREWQRLHPVVSAVRLPSVARMVIAPFPGASLAQYLVLGKLGLVDFALDDVADGEIGHLTDEELHEACTCFARLPSGEPLPEAWAEEGVARVLGRAIVEVSRELETSPGAPAFLALWREHFRRFCVSHLTELRHKRESAAGGRLPSLKEYLTWGWWSSGAPMYASAVLVVSAPRYEGDALGDPLIRRIFLLLGLSIRWFNDARSLAREREEGKFNNALVLLMARGDTEARAEARAVAQGDRNLERLRRAVGRLPAELQSWGAGLVTLVVLSRRVYLQHGDFHHPEVNGSGRSS